MNAAVTGPSSIYTILFGMSFLCWLLFEAWVFSRDRGKAMQGSRGGGVWVLLVFVLGITIGINMPGIAPAFNLRSYPTVYFAIGMLLVWGGLILRYWSIQTLGRFFSTRLIIQERHELITTGPYKILRHPSYTGAVLTFIGFGLGAGNWMSVIVLLATALITYAWRIRAEERMLLEQFGEAFREHKKRTWAIIPYIW